jgi:hypothetical protein
MNHPTQEQWMEYLYDEMPSPERKELESHLKGCTACREKAMELQGTTRTLDTWKVEVPAKHAFAARWQPGFKWAVAAALLVTTAFAAGRMSEPKVDVEALKAQISKPIEEKMRRDLLASEQARIASHEKEMAVLNLRMQTVAAKAVSEANASVREHLEQLAVNLAALREEDKKALTSALQSFEAQRISDLQRFREDLEKVALYSEQSYRNAQRQLVQLANYQPSNN